MARLYLFRGFLARRIGGGAENWPRSRAAIVRQGTAGAVEWRALSHALRIDAADGRPLAARLFPAGRPRAAVAVASAMGVPQRHYAAFAEWLAKGGFTALTFDYRGVGGSAVALRGDRATLHEWGEQDLEGALRFLARRLPGLPRLLVAHSVGGQIAGLAPESEKLAGLVFVASSNGWWGHFRGPARAALIAAWYAGLPLLTCALGYAPLSLIGGEDLPAGIAREWVAWGRRREYVLSYARDRPAACYGRITAPLLSFAFTDDGYAPVAGVAAMTAAYPRARATLREVRPEDAGGPVGHFGFFRERFKATLWRETAAFLGAAR